MIRAAVAAFILSLCSLPALAVDWSGCHAGVDIGVARARSQATDLPYDRGPYAGMAAWNTAGDRMTADDVSGAVGISTGCDRQVATLGSGNLVIGGVMDFALLNASGSAGFGGSGRDTSAAFELHSAASLRFRVGYAQDRSFYYLTGGYARGDVDVSARDQGPPAMMQVSNGGGRSGWVIGAGVEWAIAPSRTLEASLLHYDFGTLTATGEAEDPAGAYPRFEHDIRADVLRIGMNWRF